jgi:hypothetical protein
MNSSENANDIKGLKMAFQALNGGTMPLTRSNQFNCLLDVMPWRRDFLAQYGT